MTFALAANVLIIHENSGLCLYRAQFKKLPLLVINHQEGELTIKDFLSIGFLVPSQPHHGNHVWDFQKDRQEQIDCRTVRIQSQQGRFSTLLDFPVLLRHSKNLKD
jgi:hypothetical protein